MKVKEYLKFIDMAKSMNEKIGFFDIDIDYIIKDGKAKNSYIVTSWTTGKAPKNIYTVNKQGNKWKCNCPTRTPYCKHIDMVNEWIKVGKPSIIDAEAEDDLRKLLQKKGVDVK